MKTAGRMKRIIGTVIVAGSFAAFSSATSIRSSRISEAMVLSAWLKGVP